jgi:hypothetical protein
MVHSENVRLSILKENIDRGDLFKVILTPINGFSINPKGTGPFVSINPSSSSTSGGTPKKAASGMSKAAGGTTIQSEDCLFAIQINDDIGNPIRVYILDNPKIYNEHSVSFTVNSNIFPDDWEEFLLPLLVIKDFFYKGKTTDDLTAKINKNNEKNSFDSTIYNKLNTAGTANLNIKTKVDEVIEVQLQRNIQTNLNNHTNWNAIVDNRPIFSELIKVTDIILGDKNNIISKLNGDSKLKNILLPTEINDSRLPFINSESYGLLKFGISKYLKKKENRYGKDLDWKVASAGNPDVKSYYDIINDIIEQLTGAFKGDTNPSLPNYELIWNYWMEQGMLVQSINMISFRFQNIDTFDSESKNPLNRFDIAPLYPLSDLMWSYIQDEQNTLIIKRRMNEYLHEYGLNLIGKAVGNNRSIDSRSKFLEAFNTLLNNCALFYKDADDTTRKADGFPLLNCLREVHMLLAEGFHNAYSNLTFTSRVEMTLQQVILARPEMQEFLGSRPMVPYSEPWIGRVDSIRQMNGWGSTSMSHFYDLANNGERLLLSIRFTSWNQIDDSEVAADWAETFRSSIQRYIHSYRTVTGVDLSADSSDNKEMFAVQPSMLIQRRVQNEKMLSMPRRNFARQAYY